jgi:hypothetical protein
MPQMSLWPFMARTMVEDVHGVKPLPFVAAPLCRQNARHLKGIRRCRSHRLARAANQRRGGGEFLIRLWGLTQP